MTELSNYQVKHVHDPDGRYGEEPEETEKPAHDLDSEKARHKLRKLLEWHSQERERQAINRYQMSIDEDFYDHLQWSDEDALELRERGQAPLVFNYVKPTIDWIIGTEKRTRVDYKVYPREEDDEDAATAKTKLLKYLSDVNKTQFGRSRAFADSAKVGLGWMESGVRGDPTDELLFSRYESWRNIIYDSSSIERDLSDARYIFRWKWVDLDIAQTYFPDRKNEIRQAAIAQDLFGTEQDEDLWYLGQHFQAYNEQGEVLSRRTYISDASVINRRERVKLIECWYRQPVNEKICCGELYHGKVYDNQNSEMVQAQRDGVISVYDRVKLKMHCAVFTEGHLLQDVVSPYNHNRFPFTPIWCYRRGRDNAPYGVIRGIRDAQEDLNKRASKSLFILSTNKIIMDEGAVEDVNELREEAARPDSIIVKTKGKELTIDRDTQLAEEHLMLMDRDKQMIEDTGGVTQENQGRETNATSGKAIVARQEQGAVVTTELFDNLRYSMQLQGETELSLVEQFYTDRKVIRLTGNQGQNEWLVINDAGEDGELINDITRTSGDFIVGEQDFRQSIRIAMFESLSKMVQKLQPEIAIQLLDVVVKMSDVPDKDEIVARIRKINGHTDPNEKLSPEEQKALEAKQREQQEKTELEKDLQKAEVRKIVSESIERLTKAQEAAIKGATQLATMPSAAPVADAILEAASPSDDIDVFPDDLNIQKEEGLPQERNLQPPPNMPGEPQ